MCSSSFNEKLESLNQSIKILIGNQDSTPRSSEENENKEIAGILSPGTNTQLSAGDTVLHKDVENLLLNGIINPSHTIAANWIKLFDYFQMRISNICVKLMNVENNIKEIDGKFSNMCIVQENSSKIKKEFQETLNAYNLDISKLENEHFKQLLEFEDKLSEELDRIENYFHMKNNDLKVNYERKLHDLVTNYEEQLNIQNIEIERLNSIIEDEFHRIRNEVKKLKSFSKQNEPQKIDSLRRKIEILRESLTKKEQEHIMVEKLCMEKFSALIRQHEKREKSLQIQLATQRAELTIQKDVPDDHSTFLRDIEKRYQKLLIEQRSIFTEQHKKDMKTIAELTERLESYKQRELHI